MEVHDPEAGKKLQHCFSQCLAPVHNLKSSLIRWHYLSIIHLRSVSVGGGWVFCSCLIGFVTFQPRGKVLSAFSGDPLFQWGRWQGLIGTLPLPISVG